MSLSRPALLKAVSEYCPLRRGSQIPLFNPTNNVPRYVPRPNIEACEHICRDLVDSRLRFRATRSTPAARASARPFRIRPIVGAAYSTVVYHIVALATNRHGCQNCRMSRFVHVLGPGGTRHYADNVEPFACRYP